MVPEPRIAENVTVHKIYEQNNRGWHFNHLNFLSMQFRCWHFFCPQDTVSTASSRAQTAASVTLNKLHSYRRKICLWNRVKDRKTRHVHMGIIWESICENIVLIDWNSAESKSTL